MTRRPSRPVPVAQAVSTAPFTPGDRPDWQASALCAQTDPEAFFPEIGGSTREPKKVCRACDVRPECLEYALQHNERYGVYGGMSERERRKLKRQAAQKRPAPHTEEAA